MNIIIQTPQFIASEHLYNFVKEKINQLSNHQSNIIGVKVVLRTGAKHDISNQWCEIVVTLPAENKFIKKHSLSFEESITRAVSSMERKLKRKQVQYIY
ncbi:HPF/RaiA family ribosome-associated protein [Emticicia sp. W12TSBA100-4]|uniref:HPF/RaiA family ribosome-associated protein n=1 Tax=Emticicia sp. W12TSBA100-4 TaxID=3160965 RepID=UPI003306205D